MTETVHLDANVVLRFLLADHKTHSPKVRKLFEAAEQGGQIRLYLSHVCIAEIAWVLTSFYQFERAQVAAKLKALILHAGVTVDDIEVLLKAFANFSVLNVDYIDCYHAALADAQKVKLASFDKDFRKFPDLELYDLG